LEENIQALKAEWLNPVRAKMVEKPGDWKWSRYQATGGTAKHHPCLTIDWVLGQFSGKRGKAKQEYRKFVHWGIGQKTIWTEVRGQALLGEDGFVDKLVDHLNKHKEIPEIPRSQRYANRPELEKLFNKGQGVTGTRRRKMILEAVERYGYRQKEIADHLGLHYSLISRIMKGER
jgi:putative transposase